MNILVIGEQGSLQECQEKFGDKHKYTRVAEHNAAEKSLQHNDLIFDFIIEKEPHQFKTYCKHQATVFLNTCKVSMGELIHLVGSPLGKTFGFNGLPTFLNRPILEVSILKPDQANDLKKVCDELETEYLLVEDRVGMVTPRVICMIINEGYFAVQDGTATREGVDMAMKLGTNYPWGPFEWCERIGIKHVYELIEALFNDTHDERYKICPLLKNEYLKIRL